MIHVYSKDATSIVILLAFIDVFCMNVDFYYVPFRHFLYWTYDTAYRCHATVSSECGPVQPGELKGIFPIPYSI